MRNGATTARLSVRLRMCEEVACCRLSRSCRRCATVLTTLPCGGENLAGRTALLSFSWHSRAGCEARLSNRYPPAPAPTRIGDRRRFTPPRGPWISSHPPGRCRAQSAHSPFHALHGRKYHCSMLNVSGCASMVAFTLPSAPDCSAHLEVFARAYDRAAQGLAVQCQIANGDWTFSR
jgi:hypothetical protein